MSLFFSDWNGTHKVLCQRRNVFKTISAPERMKVINELISLEDDIQKEARIQKIGFVTYSSVGIVGGDLIIAGIIAAPFTFGRSLALSVAGGAATNSSGVAGVTPNHTVKENTQ